MTIATASPRVRARHERRRREVLRAALRAFREHGYHATTLETIAAYLGIRNTALYHYFPDKEAILYECHRVSLDELLGRLDVVTTMAASASDRLAQLIREHVRVLVEVCDGSPAAFEVTALSPRRRAEIIELRDRYERGLRRLIAEGIANGEFRPVDAKVAAFTILGALNWISRWYRPEGELGARELGEQFAAHLVGGLQWPWV